jgi:hypothetical protein
MQTRKHLKYLAGVLFLALVGLAVMNTEFNSLSDLIDFGGHITIAATVGAVVKDDAVTVEEVKAKSPDLDRDYVSKKITEMKPANTPLDTIMRHLTAVPIKSFRTNFYSVDTRPLVDKVLANYTKPADGSELAEIAVVNIDAWSKDDTTIVRGILGTDNHDLMLYVADINQVEGKIKVQAVNGPEGTGANAGKVIVPSIAANTVLVRGGSAKSEKDAQTSPYAMLPVKEYNLCQLFMAQVEESTYQRMHDQEVDWGFSDYEALNIYDMKARMEISYLWGFRGQFYDKIDKDMKYTTGGVTRFVPKVLEYGTGGGNMTMTKDTYVNWMKEIFTGNSGSDSRILFADSNLLASLHLIDDVNRQLDASKTEVKWGITFKVIETNFGRLLIKHHNLYDITRRIGEGLVLDINNVEKHVFLPTQITKLDLIKSGQKNADASVIAETSTTVLRYPDTHARIRPKA